MFRPPRFALKGGTALNLFAHDMPRLSVDIDVVFTDHTLNREDALRAIAADLRAAKSAICALGFRAHLPTAKRGENVKLLIEGNGQSIKVEVNFVLRGTVLPVIKRPLVPRAQELFTTDITLPVLDLPELYGGKLVAAMDRQHPRDMFDVLHKTDAGVFDTVSVEIGHSDQRGSGASLTVGAVTPLPSSVALAIGGSTIQAPVLDWSCERHHRSDFED